MVNQKYLLRYTRRNRYTIAMNEIEYNEIHIEKMREWLIQSGAGGSFASLDTPTYWEAERIIEEFEKRVPKDDRIWIV